MMSGVSVSTRPGREPLTADRARDFALVACQEERLDDAVRLITIAGRLLMEATGPSPLQGVAEDLRAAMSAGVEIDEEGTELLQAHTLIEISRRLIEEKCRRRDSVRTHLAQSKQAYNDARRRWGFL